MSSVRQRNEDGGAIEEAVAYRGHTLGKAFAVIAVVHAILFFLLGVPPFDHVAHHVMTRYHPVARQLKPLYTAQAIATAHAVSTAWQLGIFDTLAAGTASEPLSANEIATQHGLPLKGVVPLLELLAASDYLYVTTSVRSGDEISLYSNSATAQGHLLSGLPPAQNMGPMIHLLTSMADATGTMKGAVEKGSTVLEVHSEVFPNPKFESFARITGPLMHGTAVDMVQMLSKKMGLEADQSLRVLDIAAGSGEYGYTVAQAFPKAHVTMNDHSLEILETTRQNGFDKQRKQQNDNKGTNFMDRVEFVAGDIMRQENLQPLHSFDVVLIPNLLQMWSKEKSLSLLHKVNQDWIRPGGMVVLVEICRKGTPYSLWEGASPPSRTFGMMGLYMSEDATLYTLEELLEMMRTAGFDSPQHAGDSFPFACFVVARKMNE